MEDLARPASRPCTGTNRDGEPCGNRPIPGGFVCRNHGGAAPQVKKSAKARLLAGADLAIDYLLNLLTPRPPCEACGRSDADRDPVVVKACQLVLDRSGFHPSLTVQHVEAPDKYADLTIDETVQHLEALLDQARVMRDEQRHRDQALLGEGVIDAVVDDGVDIEDDELPVAVVSDGYDTLTSAPEPVADDPSPSGNGTDEKWTPDNEDAK